MTLETDLPSAVPLPQLFLDRVERSADRIVSYTKVDGRWQGQTWRQGRQNIEEIALGLLEIGVRPGDRVAILSQTRREWSEADLANLCIGAITVGIYPSLTGAQGRQLLELSGARVVFVEDQVQQAKLRQACAGLEPAVRFVCFDKIAHGEDAITLDDLRRRGAQRRAKQPEEFVRRVHERSPSDVVSYIYTSGTTGEPKGAMLTHANFHYVMHATSSLIDYTDQRVLLFLPLAHSLQRYASYLGLIRDVQGYYAESMDAVSDNLREVRPTAFALVPRILEKIHAKAMAAAEAQSPVRKRVFDRALGVLQHVGSARRDNAVPGLRARLAHRVADQLVGAKVRERMGGQVKFIGSGGAPLANATHEFFEDIGVPVLEGYGLTETSAPATLNTLDMRRIGTVGRPLPGTEIRIAADGEVLIRGPGVFGGYYADEEATKNAFNADGWFKSGDIGVMSRDGFLTITDRKKDIIITAGGKNVAPQPLENALKRHPWVGQAVVIGDQRPYLTALVALDPDHRAELIAQHGLPEDASPAAIAEVPQVAAALESHRLGVNAHRPSFEQIKKVELLPEDLTIENGALTPTLKVKRRTVNERYANEIEALYQG